MHVHRYVPGLEFRYERSQHSLKYKTRYVHISCNDRLRLTLIRIFKLNLKKKTFLAFILSMNHTNNAY
jgi:hypothetical protein